MGDLDLPAQFGRKVDAMISAIADGRALHKTRNIKASGQPLENSLRQLLEDSLPSTCKVASGYFYGANSDCSPEIDVLVYEDKEAFRLDPASQDQHYIPYTSVSIMGQVKNSAADLPGAIEQVQRSIRSWHEMRSEMAAVRGGAAGGPPQEVPLTFVVCGECKEADLKKLPATLKKKGRPFVNYILLLDRGEIVAGNQDFFEFDDPSIDFYEYRNVNALQLCKPGNSTTHALGAALLWFYFALVSKLSLDQGNNLRYHTFCNQVSSLYPLRPIKKLL